MNKLLVVFGATSQQGGSVVDYVLNDPELSKQYSVRGVTRDPTKPAGQALQLKGVEVVKGDLDDVESIKQALRGAHAVFVMTISDPELGHLAKQRETDQAKAAADAAVEAGARYLIFSTLPHAGKLSGGKLQHVVHFDAKADAEEYIRGLPIKSAFLSLGSFMQNFHELLAPRPVGDGTYVVANILKPDTPLPLIDVVADAGKFVGAVLAEPDEYAGAVLSAAVGSYTYEEITRAMSEATGKTIVYTQVPDDVFRGFLPPQYADELVEMLQLIRDYGYYGPRQAELVEWSAQQARGELTTLAAYLAKNPLNLQSQ
jgi:uncharacterized protein YbjT (DUF2867 family)